MSILMKLGGAAVPSATAGAAGAGGGSGAVMLDCDGVLVDSERLIAEILVDLANAAGARLTVADGWEMFHGQPLDTCVERISAQLGRPAPPGLAAEYRRRSADLFRRRLTAVDGAEELVRSLTVPGCVVSNSSRARTLSNLEVTGLLRYFPGRVFSAQDLARAKPAPDVYRHASAQLRVDPARCVAIEDSAVGVRSAAGAGMFVIGFAPHDGAPDRASELRRNGARWTCRSMREVHRLVRSLTRP
jgi:HAD superfamily hydrolase (TIGR01509 family)